MAEYEVNPVPLVQLLDRMPLQVHLALIYRCAQRVEPICRHTTTESRGQFALPNIDDVMLFLRAFNSISRGDLVRPKAMYPYLFRPSAPIPESALYLLRRCWELSGIIYVDGSGSSKQTADLLLMMRKFLFTLSDHGSRNVFNPWRTNPRDAESVLEDLAILETMDFSAVDLEDFQPDYLGPLWPRGEPTWWTDLQSDRHEQSTHVGVEFAMPADLEDTEVERAVMEVLQGINAVHLAYGGNGLVIADCRSYEPALELEPVGGGV